jgi:hypothetical protein
MEQNFQTSFIPKKSIVRERVIMPRSISFMTIVAIFILFAVLIGTGGLYFYKSVLSKNITEMENTLSLARNRFEPTKIAEIQALDNRLKAATEILGNHISITPIFKELEKVTMKTIRFTSFGYTLPTESDSRLAIQLKGIAIGYRAVALQEDLFAKNKNFIETVFSNLQLDDKGYVLFDLNFSVDPSFVNYKQTVATESGIGS